MAISLTSMRNKLANKVFTSPPAGIVTFYELGTSTVSDSNYPSDIVESYNAGTSTYGITYDLMSEDWRNKKPYSDYPEASLAVIVNHTTTVKQNMKVTIDGSTQVEGWATPFGSWGTLDEDTYDNYIVLAIEEYRYGGGVAAKNVILGKQIDL